MDYARLRAAAFKDGGVEEAVTVDTRALIDKVLARYSGEWTTLRELIQNAADAQATTVKIKWETLPSTQIPLPATTNRSEHLKHVLTHHTLGRLVVENNGQPFTETDWRRLKRIAEGNPDETKIGAFGVGFYSVFADCEEPLVSSGHEAMAFYWKGNALFTRKLNIPQGEGSSNTTTFFLEYRNRTTPLPNLLSIGQFLATSLTFVALHNIEFWVDDWCLLSLQKKTSPSATISIPKSLVTTTKDGYMTLASADRTSTQIDATVMSVLGWKPQAAPSSGKHNDSYYNNTHSSDTSSLRSFFSKLTSGTSLELVRSKAAKEEKAAQDAIAEDVTATSKSSIFLRVTTAQVVTNIPRDEAAELERATKKPPPKRTKIALLTSSYDETVASELSSGGNSIGKHVDVFSTVLPSKKPGGRIFIGFPTTQTTGAGMHISAQSVIPTVEREAIDLNARWVRTWNIEMLRVAGIISRLAFSNEMADLQAKLTRLSEANSKKGSSVKPEDVEKCIPEAMHILKTYSFEHSTPSGQVAHIIEEAFWTCYKQAAIEVFSSRGVLSTKHVRLSSEEVGRFVSGIPVILKQMKESPFIQKLISFAFVRDITVDDICTELGAKALDKDQLHHFISWMAKGASTGELDQSSRLSLLDVAVATISEGGDSGDIIALGSIKNFLGPTIPSTFPIPPTTMPIAFTSNIPQLQLRALGWEPLGFVPWLRFLIESGPGKGEEWDLSKSSDFATRVLVVLSKNWENLSHDSKNSVVSMLQNMTVMPTKVGMRKPGESFFPSVKLFDDLPTIQVSHNLKEKFLTSLGVRKTVDLETIFTRLLSPSPTSDGIGHQKWSHMELIKYLTSVRDDIPAADMKKLRESQLCPAEAGPPGMEPTKRTERLYKVSELYEPKDTLRTLGLPILQWPGPPGSFRNTSNEARFLYKLGLQPYPAAPVLVDMMASSDQSLRSNAMKYFIVNHQLNGYTSVDLSKTPKAIMPLQPDGKKRATPSNCYTNERAAVLGYNILHKELHPHASMFGVAPDPPMTGCVELLLANPPRDHGSAVTLFSYFASRAGELGTSHLLKLKDARIVPVSRKDVGSGSEKGGSTQAYITPSSCYLGSSTTYGEIFDFVDFGGEANLFLFRCGAKTEPTKLEIARMACGEPARLLSILQSPEKYMNLLRTLSEDLPNLKRDRELFKKMKTAPWLLGFRELTTGKEGGESKEEDEAPIKQYQLASASHIVVLDDYISYRLFKQSLLCAPEEDALEAFYMALGSETLGSKVDEEVRHGPSADKQAEAQWLRKHVLERSKLFLWEYSKYKRDSIKHDERWLEKNLRVEAVRSLALRRSLKGSNKSHTEKRSAASAQSGNIWTLYVSVDGRPDMYQVGQAICQLLLTRPGQQAYFFFEPFLKLDLLDLRARGYNVDRILRAKAAELRVAEEERRKALEAEQQSIREREQEFNRQTQAAQSPQQDAKTAEPKTPKPKMPGSFDESPEEDTSQRQKPFGRGLFSNLTRRLGFETDDDSNKPMDKLLPPPAPEPTTKLGTDTQQKPKDDGRVTNPGAIQQNLLNAIKSTRAHDSSHLFSRPEQTQVKEQGTYCDSKPAQNITFAADAPGGMRVFVAKDLSMSVGTFLSANMTEIKQFEGILKEVGGVYGLSSKAMHIYFDESGGTIAFNSNGSIFCNMRYFNQLHAAKMKGAGALEGKVEAATWWWVVVAHELAHNLVELHNSDHSYYTESFIQQYFPKMMAKAMQFRAAGSSSANEAGPSSSSAASEQPQPLAPPPPYSMAPAGYQSLLD
ncbi:hypothetical protein QBC39DRAFT_49648 [Podospora conica]|nr:hypothetical protein QBC39DRAFT_49648 [Schizothecium conicum]